VSRTSHVVKVRAYSNHEKNKKKKAIDTVEILNPLIALSSVLAHGSCDGTQLFP